MFGRIAAEKVFAALLPINAVNDRKLIFS